MQKTYGPEFERRIKAFINEKQPFGPDDTRYIEDSAVAGLLFDAKIASVRSVLEGNFLVGRRGSGKSAVLCEQTRGESFEGLPSQPGGQAGYDFIIALTQWREFPSIRAAVAVHEHQSGGHLPVEWVAQIWESVFWYYISKEILRSAKHELRSRPSFAALNNLLPGGLLPPEITQELRSILKDGENPRLLADMRSALAVPTGEALKAACTLFLKEASAQAVITIDSMEEYQIHDRTHQLTLAGMIRAAAQINNANAHVVRIILCLPSETYSRVVGLSTNPNDFGSVDYLRWSAVSLLQAAAHRYRLFLEVHDPHTADRVAEIDIRNHSDILTFWRSFLPNPVTNLLGFEEDPLAYIVRHTQLLPRQLILYMNELAIRSYRRTRQWGYFDTKLLPGAIYGKEKLAAQGVVAAFKGTYPDVLEACIATLSHCSIVVGYDELQKLWEKHARRYLNDIGLYEFHEFVKMLSEMGIIGRLAAGWYGNENYVGAEFEYREKDPLVINEKDHLCIHPMFYGLFGIKVRDLNRNTAGKTVYPVGTELENTD